MDRREAIALAAKGFVYGIGGFCTLWVILALYLTVTVDVIPDRPIVVKMNEPVLLYKEGVEEEHIDPPVTIPSVPTTDNWILVRRRINTSP